MKKDKLLLMLPIMILCGWLPKIQAQTHAGLAQYYYVGTYKTFVIVPVAYYQAKNWYAEGRYNYEATNTLSLYGGKTFEKTATVSYVASPILGLVLGRLNGGSAGINLELVYKKVCFNTQSQYTFSMEARSNSFLYSWTDLTYKLATTVDAGISLQQTKLYQTNGTFEKGFVIKKSFRSWSVPLYVFRPETSERYFVLGINYEWQKNSAKNSIN